ncbi:hypothetical protein [Enterococcus sp. BWR-S5]|uniref:hypothetical protein n=1 Tax=Enterococcus sp. BWR-S5 TaxID=2787714 RepID=UPI0019233AB3|nr:hypothetical protein [Enterococcus sp. BWR-S5]MBL1225984.1 hypothetical protein [Enterococcus sp. BWR-S5]
MKRKKWLSLSLLLLLLMTCGCSANKEEEANKQDTFSEEVIENIKEKAEHFSDQEFQEGEVPLNSFVQISGTILKSDSGKNQVKKGDRFILINEGSQYQVFNEQDGTFEIGENITVYGEYYGFLKGILIEKDGSGI